MNQKEKTKLLETWIFNSERIVVLTDTTIFHHKLWKNSESLKTFLNYQYFISHPESFYQYLSKQISYIYIKPTYIHRWIASLEQIASVQVITLNIDFLHQLAGSKEVIELRGNMYEYICMRCGKKYNKEILNQKIPVCTCKGFIRPNITFFDEKIKDDRMSEAIFSILKSDMMIVIGSSFSSFISYYQGKKSVLISLENIPNMSFDLIFHEEFFSLVKKLNIKP